jgi:hypothetical protein
VSASVSLIGIAFPGTRIHLLSPGGSPVPAGEPGEICVGGPGVGHGYWNRPEWTARRFQTVAADVDPDGRILRTGDLGRIRPDGIVEFISRAGSPDGRGPSPVRIAAIEAALRTHRSVSQALLLFEDGTAGRGARRGKGRQGALAAYVVLADGEVLDPADLSRHLREVMAHEPQPDRFVVLPALPRTRAGKVDRSRPPRPATAVDQSAFGAAKSAFAGAGFVGSVLLWRGAMDLRGVPGPWAGLFVLLYVVESLSFGLGITFLMLGASLLGSLRQPRALTRAAHLATVWLLIAWLPQDDLYRLAAKTDWPRQAVLVYTFNVTLMIAAAVVARFIIRTLSDRIRAQAGADGPVPAIVRPRESEQVRTPDA